MSYTRQSQTKPAQKCLTVIQTYLSQPYIHTQYEFCIRHLSEHPVVIFKKWGVY